MRDLARWEYDADSLQYTYDDVWDATMTYGCVCGTDYEGPECAERICPRGDDPLTSGQVNEIQLISCSGTGWFTVRFRGAQSARIKHSYSVHEVEAALEAIGPSLGDVSVSFSDANATAACPSSEDKVNVLSVEFESVFGSLPPLVIEDFTASFSGTVLAKSVGQDADRAYFTTHRGVAVLASEGDKEFAPCAGRGDCPARTGACECYSSNFELYGSSDLYGGPGLQGDCGYPLTDITTCPGETECNDNGICRGGDVYDDDATPFPTMSQPKAEWAAAKPFACVCKVGWKTGDCTQRVCPRGPTWFGYPTSDELAHDALVECSGKGACDRVTGACECPHPFTGGACELLACPGAEREAGACAGKGRCLSMRELAIHAESNGDDASAVYGNAPNVGSTWDADRVFGCLCDEGFTGHDCALRSCVLGDDPGTHGQSNELQLFACRADAGKFTLTFREATTRKLHHNATAAAVEEALEALATIGTVSVQFSLGSAACADDASYANVVYVQFETEHGDLPSLSVATALLSRNGKAANANVLVKTDAATLTDADGMLHTSITGDTETDECANRGLCDTQTGDCTCFRGYSMSNGLGGPGTIPDCGYRLPYTPLLIA